MPSTRSVEDQYEAAQGDRLPHRRHDRGGLGRGDRPRQRPAGRLHPAPLRDRRQGRGHARGAAGCLRRRQPGRHRLRAAAEPAERASTSAASRRTSRPSSPRCWSTANDPAFQNPTKPIGGFMDEAEAKRRAGGDGLERGRGRRPRLAARGGLPAAQGDRRAGLGQGPARRGHRRDHRRRRRHPGRRRGQRRLHRAPPR